MGWWTTDRGDLLGDGPLDTIAEALTRVAQAREAEGRAKPTPQALVDAAPAALHLVGRAVGATLNPGGRRLTSGPEVEPDLRDALTEAFGVIGGEYGEAAGRPPTTAELLLTLEVGLVPAPGRFLQLEEGEEVTMIESVAR